MGYLSDRADRVARKVFQRPAPSPVAEAPDVKKTVDTWAKMQEQAKKVATKRGGGF